MGEKMIYQWLDRLDAFFFKNEFEYTDQWADIQMWILGVLVVLVAVAIIKDRMLK
jgi:hypothetical protein